MACSLAASQAACSSSSLSSSLARPALRSWSTAAPRRALHSGLRPSASNDKQQQQQQVPEAPSEPAQEGRVYREFQSLGMKVVETDTPLPGPETETDFWEGEKFESMGKVLENYFIPGVVVIAILIGGWAAKNYDNDADIFIKPGAGPDQSAAVIFATPPAAAPGLSSE